MMTKRILTLALLCVVQLSSFNFQLSTASAQPMSDRGFIHPGGLHTQEDFDRVKAQIAGGNTKVKQAYQVLKNASYAQPTVTTSPTETIVRGGSGENYMNAARATTMAYQNALRWKLEGNKQCANAAVRILMAWANKTKAIGGDTNYALAAGLYGYQFAQAAEIMRDYEGWSSTDFATFQQWMLDVWYPSSLGFLCKRNGTWENGSKWWQAPGHYWSNWGLANAMCVALIGILCDDVFIYNQGMSFFKYDQVGTFTIPPTLHEVAGHGDADGGQCILNNGLTEFLGNLVVTDVESELETGAYGHLGQLNESGRDAGHSSLSVGLAVDLAKIGWSQGDDLFAYMDHRLAAGIEYLAAQTQSVQNLPWTDYMYGTNGYYYTDSRAWLMTEPVLGAGIRPYWGTVIGIYEGVKGVKMPFSELAYKQMGIDGGGQGSTSGGYDHMGYSVLMNTRDEQLCPADKVPTELSHRMEYSGTLTTNLIPSLEQEQARGLVRGSTLMHNELGGLVNNYASNNNYVPAGEFITLIPQLPEGEQDTGAWEWNTGATTRNITVDTDHSYIYRVTYTNARGIKSRLCFPIAAKGDGASDRVMPFYTIGEVTHYGSDIVLDEGQTLTLGLKTPASVKDAQVTWSEGTTGKILTLTDLHTSCTYTATVTVDGTLQSFTFNVVVKVNTPMLPVGNFLIQEVATDRLLTGHGLVQKVTFEERAANPLAGNQVWFISNNGTSHAIVSLPDSLGVNGTTTKLVKLRPYAFFLDGAAGTDHYALHTESADGTTQYWTVNDDGSLLTTTSQLTTFPFRLLPFEVSDGIESLTLDPSHKGWGDRVLYELSGRRVAVTSSSKIPKGLYIENRNKYFTK